MHKLLFLFCYIIKKHKYSRNYITSITINISTIFHINTLRNSQKRPIFVVPSSCSAWDKTIKESKFYT